MNNTRTIIGTVAALAIIAIAVGIFFWWQSGSRGETLPITALEQETPVTETVEEISLDKALLEVASGGDPAEVGEE